MKRWLCVFVGLVPPLSMSSLAADSELARLRKVYEAELQRVTAPVQTNYQRELQKLLDRHTKVGKLDDALAVKTELERVGGKAATTATSGVSTGTDSAALRQKLITGRFVLYFDPPRAKAMTFLESGEIGEGRATAETRWKLEGDDLSIYNDVEQVSHSLRYQRSSDSWKTGTRPSLHKARGTYMVNQPASK